MNVQMPEKKKLSMLVRPLFATSGGSGFGNTVKDLIPCVDDTARFISEKVMNGVSDDEIKDWIISIV